MGHYRKIVHQEAFTLVELLVVIGILAILITLVTPGLRQARERSREAAAISNFRGIGQAEAVFRHDNRNHVSGHGQISFDGSRELPQWSLAPYLSGDADLAWHNLTAEAAGAVWRPLHDPAIPRELTWQPDTFRYAMAWNDIVDYDASRLMGQPIDSYSWVQGFVRLTSISRPASLIQATAGYQVFSRAIATDPGRRDLPSSPPAGGPIYYPHGGRTTALFFDGRVRMVEAPIPEYHVNPDFSYADGPVLDL